MDAQNYSRRHSDLVRVGNIIIGGDAPIRIQSMNSTSTMDTLGSVEQAIRIADAGGEIVRLTAQGVREAENLGEIRAELRRRGYDVPLVADIHFNPRAAFAAATKVEKVRINPGNFADPGRTFKKLEYTDEEYAEELRRIDDAVTPFLELCKENNTAIRIGVNHGSLSDRIMSRYGDTPSGMVESALEFLRICKKRQFTDVVISIKASNTVVMVETVRRLVEAMDKEDMHFPLHLGVTEAGDGEDGRVKSAVGIGTLLMEGIGDTIRVSLSEEPELEIPVARELVDYVTHREHLPKVNKYISKDYNRITPSICPTVAAEGIGGDLPTAVIGVDFMPDSSVLTIDAADELDEAKVREHAPAPIMVTTSHPDKAASVLATLHRLRDIAPESPVAVSMDYEGEDADATTLHAAVDFGTLLMAGFCNAIGITNSRMNADELSHLAFTILQASRRRFTKTEYISCPSCGRTLFDLQQTLHKIKAATSHLPGLKIGVMGCIVNGPGEMADADYGYVGAAAGHVSLYRGKECITKNIPADDAIDKLIELLKSDGKWTDPC
ncbi:MAG: (E)-4-hydroxy-3-methylbut-2-enyl-diphosphate synthase [Muribaculaceae bacterium]|nr:(E)-4-hydroxy-3-methylbut-2-enyl-diphosphate synthase [Muribaculaceae bacterium]